MRWLHFLLSHSIFISCCALALCYQTYTLLHVQGDGLVYGFVFFSTLCSYNFYWLISKYSFRKTAGVKFFLKNNLSYVSIFFIAGAGTLFFLLKLPGIIPWVAIAVALTIIYSLPLWPFPFAKQLRNAGFLKTTLLAFTWAYVTTIIPGIRIHGGGWNPLLTLFAARFFFMALLCIIFDTRDIKVDKMNALRSLATDVSQQLLGKIMVFAFICYIAAGLAVRLHFGDNSQLTAFLITGLLVWWVYTASRKPQGYIFYYFVVDGLMLFSAAATFIASFFDWWLY
jgi:hypothetical protein